MATITKILVGTVVAGMVILLFTLFIADVNESYGTPEDYDEDDINMYDQLANLTSAVEETKATTENTSETKGTADILGDFFSGGYKAMRVITQAYNTFYEGILKPVISKLGLGEAGTILLSGVGLIVMIIIFVGIVLASLIKSGKI